MIVWFATGNTHKKQELAEILSDAISSPAIPGDTAFELKIPRDVGLEFDPEETGTTFFENALIKAGALYRLLEEKGARRPGDPIVADDSGICVDELGGRPGIYSARYCGPEKMPDASIPHNLTDADRNVLLLEEMDGHPRRNSRFVCAMVLYYSPDRFFVAQETLEGELVKNIEAARGKGGFGYDPILYIPELGHTVAELTEEEKNQWSHRGKAGRAIARIIAYL